MTKDVFLEKLKEALSDQPEKEVENTISFYSEMIADRVEDGLSEEDAVSSVGTVEEIVAQVVDHTSRSKISILNTKPSKRLRPWEILLLVLGSPIWLSLGIAVLAVVFSFWISLWAVIISLWSVCVSMVASGFGCTFGGIVLAATGKLPEGLVALSAGLVCGGLGILLFFGCKWITDRCIALTKKLLLWSKTILKRNRGEHHE